MIFNQSSTKLFRMAEFTIMRYIATYLDECERCREVPVTANSEVEAVTILERIVTALGFVAVGVSVCSVSCELR